MLSIRTLALFVFVFLMPMVARCEDPAAQDQGPETQMDHDIISGIVCVATFDDVTDLNLSSDEGWVSSAATYLEAVECRDLDEQYRRPGFHIAENAGRLGDALRFATVSPGVLFYRGDEFDPGGAGIARDAQMTISIWIRMEKHSTFESSPVKSSVRSDQASQLLLQLAQPQATGPTLGIELTGSVESEDDRKNQELRLVLSAQPRDGSLADLAAKNLTRVKRAPFGDGHWHHLCLTIGRMNFQPCEIDGERCGPVIAFYVDGRRMGQSLLDHEFSFDHSKAALILGHRFVGDLDHLWISDRMLSDQEVRRIFQRPELFR